jgi:DHA2 family methylenomycin A resistance protein-like MFS transporter
VAGTQATRSGGRVVRLPERSRPTALVFLGLSIGNFLVLLDTSILNVALPEVQRSLGAGEAALPWAAVAYTITFAGLLLAAGAVADRFGARRVYVGSLAAFALMSLACAAAPTVTALIGGRVLLGATAACMVPSSIALLAGLYADAGARARAIGAWAALTSSGLLLGPILGGLLVGVGGWRLVFLVNPPVALLALVLNRGRPNPKPPLVRPLDLPGIGLSVVTLTALTLGLIQGGTSGWRDPLALGAVSASVVAAAALWSVERRVEHPVLPPVLFARRDLSASLLAAALATLVFYGILYTVTLWLQRERGLSPVLTGLSFVPMTLPMCVLPVFTGRLVARFGARRVILGGLSFDLLAGVLLLGVTSVHGSLLWVALSEVALVLASTTVIPAATADIAVNAPQPVAGAAQGALNAGRQAGSALGVALLGPLTVLSHAGVVLAVLSAATLALVATSGRRTAGG